MTKKIVIVIRRVGGTAAKYRREEAATIKSLLQGYRRMGTVLLAADRRPNPFRTTTGATGTTTMTNHYTLPPDP
jgi:hypothetical protein